MKLFKELSVFDRITFVEKTHTYLIDEIPTNKPSVTRLLKRYKAEFDKEKTAKRVAKKKGMSVEEVLSEWDAANLYSTTIGTMLHKYIENFYCNKKIEFEGSFENLTSENKQKILETFPKLVEMFQTFYKDYNHCFCVRSEMVLGDVDDTKVCGITDMLVYNSEKEQLEIWDFKTNKKMEKNSPWGNLFYPFENMTEGEINEYTIQLNCYKYFIEKYTNLEISSLKLIWFNVINSTYKVFELANIQSQIKLMFDHFKSNA